MGGRSGVFFVLTNVGSIPFFRIFACIYMLSMQKYVYLSIVWTVLVLAGCNRGTQLKSLGENEYYIGDKLASLSADPDSTFWIGGESGKMWHIDGDRVTDYITGTDRIYKISTRPSGDGDTICWLGVRNSGLQVWRLHNGKITHEHTYGILFKRERYSAYDFVNTPGGIFTATSQGLYLLQPDGQFRLLYPSLDSPTAKAGAPFIIYNLCPYGERYMFAASIGGLLRVDLRNNAVDVMHRGEDIQSVAVYGDEIYSLAEKKIYVDRADGKPVRRIELDFTPRLYYRVGKVHYILRSHSVVLSEDLKHFITIPLRRDFPKGCHNLMLPDYRSEFTLFITDNAFWRIPFHSGYFNNEGIIVSACAGSTEAYYLNNHNELFRQPAADSVAVKVFALPKDEQVTQMAVTDDRRLFYVNDRFELKSVKVGGSYLKNEIFSRINTIYRSKKKVTALHLDAKGNTPCIYLGIQDGLVTVDETGVADTVSDMSDKYITTFFAPSGQGGLYMSTMDSGILYGSKGRYVTIPRSEQMIFIRDFFVSDGYQPTLTVLTNQALVRPSSQDTLALNGYSRLIAINDTLFYAFPSFGMQKYTVRNGRMTPQGVYFKDILFNPQSSFRIGETLHLVSDIGVLNVKPGQENSPRYVVFDTRVLSIRLIAAFFMGLLLLAGFVVGMQVRRRAEHNRQVWLRIHDLKERVRGMETMAVLLGQGDRQQVRKLLDEIHAIKPEVRGTSRQISNLSQQVMHKNRDLALSLSKLLERQVEELKTIKAYDRVRMIEESVAALSQDKVSAIGGCVKKNNEWLRQYEELLQKIKKYRLVADTGLWIEGVSSGMARHAEVLELECRQRPIADLDKAMAEAERDYQHIFTAEALQKLMETLEDFEKRVGEVEQDVVAEALLAEIGKLKDSAETAGRLDILREMKRTDALLAQLEARCRLQQQMEVYHRMRANVVRDREKGQDRKYDTKLKGDIADYMQDAVDRIDRLITSLYERFSLTDQDVLTEVLGFNNFTNQQARVLALLMANPKEKRAMLPEMLGIYGNLNPVISRLVNSKIKPNEVWLQNYIEKHPASMAFYVLRLSD